MHILHSLLLMGLKRFTSLWSVQKELNGTVMRVYVPQFFVSSQQRFAVTDITAPRRVTALRSRIDRVIALRSWIDRVIALRQISVTAQCYSSILFRR